MGGRDKADGLLCGAALGEGVTRLGAGVWQPLSMGVPRPTGVRAADIGDGWVCAGQMFFFILIIFYF